MYIIALFLLPVSFQTPVVCQVGQRPRKNQPSGFTTPIPSLSTQKTTYETGEPSRTNKKSKRPSFQKVSPIVFDLEDDGHVRKVYDKYVGISEGITHYHFSNTEYVCFITFFAHR